MEKNSYPLVSVVFITYKRFERLRDTYDQFVKNCSYPNLQLIVADDGSNLKIQEKIKSLKFDKYCLSPKNRGLGFNQNQGVLACDGEYILHLQDDWSLLYSSDFLEKSIELMEQDKEIGLIRFWGGLSNLSKFTKFERKFGELTYYLLKGDGSLSSEEASYYVYSDRPHLKRNVLHKQIGLYIEEKLPVLKVELDFCKRFESSGLGAAIINEYGELFDHTGLEETFNVAQKKENLRLKINKDPFLGYFWRLYIKLRYGTEEQKKWLN
jgi:glycosyltransferase involved in cell wall biosynthesis